uniref:Complement C4B (Chido/Rodgers blood group) n=1 Tax=Mastacembelus armatus TaxID=205130 RepID=A0A3Q3MGX7_9TELE
MNEPICCYFCIFLFLCSFFISAPRFFHVGVKEKVLVQMGKHHLNTVVTLYLEHETTNTLVSEKKGVECKNESDIKLVELKINKEIMDRLPWRDGRTYLTLVAESQTLTQRKSTKVMVSKHRGYIFIQTDQPMYNPTQQVKYRIFTLDHSFRPHKEMIHISVINAAGNRIMQSLKSAEGGILKDTITIPDVSKTGTWKITAHYDGDEENTVSREFQVKKFVLPSFEVNIAMEQNYILLDAKQFDFTISAMYVYGEKVEGAYHCQVGVVKRRGQNINPVFIRTLVLTGSVKNGTAKLSLNTENINKEVHNQMNGSLSDLQQRGAQIYLRVHVTNIRSGEIQEAEVFLPIVSHKYTIDLSRTRSHFLPGYPLDVVVVLRLPDGSPAAGVPIKINVPVSTDKSFQGTTDQEGAVFCPFNMGTGTQTNIEVKQKKIISRFSSPSNSYLYLSFTNKVYSVNDFFTVTFNTLNGPTDKFIYSVVISRGILMKNESHPMGSSFKHKVLITPDMVPSFRLIGYFYSQNGDVVADSAWVDVRDECEIKVNVQQKGPFEPGKLSKLEFDLHGQRAKVALLAVDKAFYALNADNKLTSKQVFSAMQSYDLGCSYGGGADSASVVTHAGLSFVSLTQSVWKKECDSQGARQRRSVDLQQGMMAFKSNFTEGRLQECCEPGFAVIPMRLTCQERAKRVSLLNTDQACTDAFLKCCLEGERLRKEKMKEDAVKELGRTASTADIEEFFLYSAAQYIRRFFPPSFAFTEFEINGKGQYSLALPDSITTWEVQVATLSADTGFCVVKPSEVRAFRRTFVSLRLPYSVKKYEQLSISPIIYNYGDDPLQVAVHMEQTEGLCSPGSATTTAFVNITVAQQSSKFVSFSAVPMKTGKIPIKIRLYDIEDESGIDAVEKSLNVWTEGIEMRDEITEVVKLDGKSPKSLTFDGTLPDGTVPDSKNNIFISLEGDGFGSSQVKNLLSPEKVARLIVLPTGCLEQTMVGLVPTALAVRYLDQSDQWVDQPAGARDDALNHIEQSYIRIFTYKKPNGSYGPWASESSSNWLTALVVKVLSLIAERQTTAFGQQGRLGRAVPLGQIRHPVSYLVSAQNNDGSFTDPYPVLHRGILKDKDRDSSRTAFITLALNRSLQFLEPEGRSVAEAAISRSTTYLLSNFEELQHPYAVAITACCLSVCLPKETDLTHVWIKLQTMATRGKNGCYLWTTNPSETNQKQADAITVETSTYALLAAVGFRKSEWASKAACWLTSQENYSGGYKSSQDTIMALEALSEYELSRSSSPEVNVIADFTVRGKKEMAKLELENKKQRVETDLKKLVGNEIVVELTGKGQAKLKLIKAYHLLDAKDNCDKLSISVAVEGKVQYTDTVQENYDYYDYDYKEMETRVSRSAPEWFDAHTRNRRETDNISSDETVTYRVCVSHSLNSSLTGMAIADITLLSGFEAKTQNLDLLKEPPEQYISHYETSHGRVLLYFNQLFAHEECISFDATQTVPIGLLQPAPAVFYDYYEPSEKCTVFYSAPQRSKLVSKLCSEDVCQCAERPCHKIQATFKLNERNRRITKSDRMQHACFLPTVDYAYIVHVVDVSVKSNFELYKTNVTEVLKSHGDKLVSENSVRVFAKRYQCKEQLHLGKKYLIMGKDGSTTDSNGKMQYLLESNTWVEQRPASEQCKKSAHRFACSGFSEFVDEYKINGCRQ